jgi:hypothetical protein
VAEDLKAGDRVEWSTSQGPTRGRVEKKHLGDAVALLAHERGHDPLK